MMTITSSMRTHAGTRSTRALALQHAVYPPSIMARVLLTAAYSRENHPMATLYLLSDQGSTTSGVINFQSLWTLSGWHGRWTWDHSRGELALFFNCRGGDRPLRSVLLNRAAAAVMTGFDYRQRFVRVWPLRRFLALESGLYRELSPISQL